MTGYFRGPPLTAHVLLLSVTLGLISPLLNSWLGPPITILVCLVLGLCYAVLALLWASGGKR